MESWIFNHKYNKDGIVYQIMTP